MKLATDYRNVFGLFSSIARKSELYLNQQYEHLQISGLQHLFITVVYRNPGIQQKEFLDWLDLDRSNVSRNLNYLEKIGYIEKRRDGNNKRNWLLYPTAKAVNAYSEIVETFYHCCDILLKDFDEEEQERFLEYLHRARNNIRCIL